jgi:hypothetical protein
VEEQSDRKWKRTNSILARSTKMDATSDLQKFIDYLEKIGVGHLAKDATELAQNKQLNTIVADARNVIAQFNDDMDDEFLTKLYKYEIPLLSEDGTCR